MSIQLWFFYHFQIDVRLALSLHTCEPQSSHVFNESVNLKRKVGSANWRQERLQMPIEIYMYVYLGGRAEKKSCLRLVLHSMLTYREAQGSGVFALWSEPWGTRPISLYENLDRLICCEKVVRSFSQTLTIEKPMFEYEKKKVTDRADKAFSSSRMGSSLVFVLCSLGMHLGIRLGSRRWCRLFPTGSQDSKSTDGRFGIETETWTTLAI